MKPANRKIRADTKKDTMGDRIDRFFTRWGKFRGHPSLCLALLSFLIYVAARTFSGHGDPAQLRFVESPTEPIVDSAVGAEQTMKPVFTGEAHDTAQRLRECGSLLIAVSLSAFEEFRVRGRFPANIDAILTGIQKRSLLPPGIEIRNGAFHSSLSQLKLSYRSDPFSFEIIALPSEGVQGPAMMFRFPLPPSGTNSIMYFESSRQQPLPAPFSTTEQLAAIGWTIRHWRGEALRLDEAAVRDLREQDAWLRTVTKGEQ
jgi:hypothetical protein